jgi:hypothetical protein
MANAGKHIVFIGLGRTRDGREDGARAWGSTRRGLGSSQREWGIICIESGTTASERGDGTWCEWSEVSEAEACVGEQCTPPRETCSLMPHFVRACIYVCMCIRIQHIDKRRGGISPRLRRHYVIVWVRTCAVSCPGLISDDVGMYTHTHKHTHTTSPELMVDDAGRPTKMEEQELWTLLIPRIPKRYVRKHVDSVLA